MHIYICMYIYITFGVHICISYKKHFCGWDSTRKALTWLYFHCGIFKIKIKF